jgi:hypothetical protein
VSTFGHKQGKMALYDTLWLWRGEVAETADNPLKQAVS